MTAPDPALLEAARAWADADPDPETQRMLLAWVRERAVDALRRCMEPPLSFGTAGLRGLLGPGPAQMNRAVIARTTAGLCAYLAQTLEDPAARGLCVGYDARHGSRAFAEEAAAVAAGAGFVVHLLPEPLPTPVLAYAVRALGAAGGVMVTASHNPPAYNGFKVYAAGGALITAPADQEIAAAIAACGPANALPRCDREAAQASGLRREHDAGLVVDYVRAVVASCPPTQCPGASDDAELGGPHGDNASCAVRVLPDPTQPVAYTPLHGVGEATLRAALGAAGFHDVVSVAAQARPDPDFPTVAFPNPEEPGALDALLALTEELGLSLALANDPDADRLAVAARDDSGALRVLDGNQLGALLGDYLLRRAPWDGRNAVVTTLVSSALLSRIAAAHGARCEVTLTGFKWIMKRAAELSDAGLRFVFGYEEALGYATGNAVRDKDGILAAVLTAQLARECASAGKTLWRRLDELYAAHGYHGTGLHTVKLAGATGPARIAHAMRALRAAPLTALAGLPLVRKDDLMVPHPATGGEQAPALPRTDAVVLYVRGGHRVCVRPSGTEPKLKLYSEVVIPADVPLAAARTEAAALLADLQNATLTALQLSEDGGPGPTDGR